MPQLLPGKCLEMLFQNHFVKCLHVGLISAAEDVIAVLKSKLYEQIMNADYRVARIQAKRNEKF